MSIMEYNIDYHVNLGYVITISVIGEQIIGFRFNYIDKLLMPRNIVFFDFKSCLKQKSFEFLWSLLAARQIHK